MIDVSKINQFIETNNTNNVICRSLELRPNILGSFISGLANNEGGYIFIGIELHNGQYTFNNFLPAFKYNDILASISTKLEPRIEVSYQLICIGTNRFLAICVDKSETPVSYDNEYYIYVPNNVVPIGKEYVNYKPTVFISYASPDAAIVDIVESAIRKSLKDKVSISRFTELHYKDSFKAFMNTIQDHDYVLCFVTYSYLRSRACMYEVGEVIKDHRYSDRLLFVVLSEKDRCYYRDNAPEIIEAGVYDPQKRADFILYWKTEYDKLDKKIKEIGDYEATRDLSTILNEIGNVYRNDISKFMEFLADENGKNFCTLKENDFADIIARIKINKEICRK